MRIKKKLALLLAAVMIVSAIPDMSLVSAQAADSLSLQNSGRNTPQNVTVIGFTITADPQVTATPAATAPTYTYGTANSATVGTVTAKYFSGTVGYAHKWYSASTGGTELAAHHGLVASVDNSGNITVSTADTTPAGTYYLELIGEYSAETATAATRIPVTVGKATATEGMKAVHAYLQTVTGVTSTIHLHPLPDGASYGTVTSNNSSYFTLSAISTDGKITATCVNNWNGEGAGATEAKTFTVAVTGADNYEDYLITVTVTPTDKHEQTVSVGSDTVTVTYGDTNKSVSATNTTTPVDQKAVGAIRYTIADGDHREVVEVNETTGALTIKKAGEATITVIAEETEDYAPSDPEYITVTVNPKAVTVTANNKSAYVGDAVPVLGTDDFTVSGLLGTDKLVNKPVLRYESQPDMTKAGTVAIIPDGDSEDAGENYTVSYVNGKLTISNRSSGGGSSSGGSSSAPAVTVPVSGDQHSVNVSATVSGTTATVNIKDADIEKVTHADADTGVVEIDLTGLKKEINTVKIPTSTMDKIADAIADSKNDTEGVSIKLSSATVTFDGTATQAIADQAKGNTIEIKVNEADKKTLTAAQKSSIEGLGSQIIVEATVISNGVKISDFKGGSATVSVPYTLKNNQKANGLVVYFVADDGSVEKIPASYVNGHVVFTVTHFSHYVIAYEEPKAAPVNPFVDVTAGEYYYDAVLWAVENGITSGVDATHFAPGRDVTRGQAVTFLWRAAGSPVVNSHEDMFTDVSESSYYHDAVLWAVANGITKGTSSTTFSPDATCTRAQIVTFLYRYNAADTMNIKHNPFVDVAEGDYFYNAVLWAAEREITGGTSATTFSPNATCTRGQVVTFLYRYMGE